MQHLLFERKPEGALKRAVGLDRGVVWKGRSRWDGWTYFLWLMVSSRARKRARAQGVCRKGKWQTGRRKTKTWQRDGDRETSCLRGVHVVKHGVKTEKESFVMESSGQEGAGENGTGERRNQKTAITSQMALTRNGFETDGFCTTWILIQISAEPGLDLFTSTFYFFLPNLPSFLSLIAFLLLTTVAAAVISGSVTVRLVQLSIHFKAKLELKTCEGGTTFFPHRGGQTVNCNKTLDYDHTQM